MFKNWRKNRPIIPIRLPDTMDFTYAEKKSIKTELAEKLPVELPVAEGENTQETIEARPPDSESSGEDSDEPSVEELTVQEVIRFRSSVSRTKELGTENTEGPQDQNPDSDGNHVNTEPRAINRINYNILYFWCIFWLVALAGGVFAYYLSTHRQMIASRGAGDTNEDTNLLLVPREKWDDSKYAVTKPTSFVAQRVVVVHTDSEGCDMTTTCIKLLNAMKVRQQKRKEGSLKYNFFLATDGCIYEGLGWQEPSPLYPKMRTLVVAFIGNYETVAPSAMQLSQFQSLLEVSEELKYLEKTYTIVGKDQNAMPSKLFAYLSMFERWDKENSDIDNYDVEVDLDPFPFFDY